MPPFHVTRSLLPQIHISVPNSNWEPLNFQAGMGHRATHMLKAGGTPLPELGSLCTEVGARRAPTPAPAVQGDLSSFAHPLSNQVLQPQRRVGPRVPSACGELSAQAAVMQSTLRKSLGLPGVQPESRQCALHRLPETIQWTPSNAMEGLPGWTRTAPRFPEVCLSPPTF